jgi:O-antigen/teichoic acid export membrane protein
VGLRHRHLPATCVTIAHMSLTSNSLAVYSTLLVRLLGSLATTAILARKLPIEDFGTLAICTGVGSLFWTACDYGLTLRGQRLFSHRAVSNARLGRFIYSSIIFRTVIALTLAPVAIALGLLHHELHFVDLPLLLMALFAGWSSAAAPGWILSLQQRNWLLLPLDACAAATNILLAAFFVSDRSELWATLVGQTTVNIALIWHYANRKTSSLYNHRIHISLWFRYFLPAMTLRTAYTIMSIGLVVVYSITNSTSDVAVYAAADRILRIAFTGLSPIFTLSAPYVFSPVHRAARARPFFRIRLIVIVGAIGVAAACAMALAGPTLIHALFGTKYDSAAPFLVILSFAIPFWMMENLVINQLLTQQRMERSSIVIVSMVSASVLVASVFGVIKGTGMMAAITVATEAMVAVGGLVVLARAPRAMSS